MIDQDSLERLIGRALTPKEMQVLKWLGGWDKETIGTVAHLIRAAYLNGRLEKSLDSKE
ncbi:hypothetical protein D3C76_1536150 [compost metagenome]